MKWALPLGRLAGIPIHVHATFALLLVWVAYVQWSSTRSVGAVAAGILFLLALFGCVVLHELGHALAARRYGIRTRDITLLPIGGVARLERIPDRPAQELWVALAGPAVNVAIAVALTIWLVATRGFDAAGSLAPLSGPFVERLLVVNLFLAVFNMIPAFPMDGGRVLRALLAMKLDYVRATRIASTVGRGAALVFGLVGLFVNPFLVLIALFVWIGATSESMMVQTRSALGGVPVGAAMMTDYRRLDRHDPIARAVELVLAGSQRDFPVLDEGRLFGVLSHERLLAALADHGSSVTVERALDPAVRPPEVDRRAMLDDAVARLRESAAPLAVVVDDDRIVGILTMENVVEYFDFRRAVGRPEKTPTDAPPAGIPGRHDVEAEPR